MINKIAHIGIAVKDLETQLNFFKNVFGLSCQHLEQREHDKVKIATIPIGDTQLELIQATSDESPIAKFISKHGEGIHHIAFQTDELTSVLKQCKNHKIELIDEKPRHGIENSQISFLHPKSTFGTLFEIIQQLS